MTIVVHCRRRDLVTMCSPCLYQFSEKHTVPVVLTTKHITTRPLDIVQSPFELVDVCWSVQRPWNNWIVSWLRMFSCWTARSNAIHRNSNLHVTVTLADHLSTDDDDWQSRHHHLTCRLSFTHLSVSHSGQSGAEQSGTPKPLAL